VCDLETSRMGAPYIYDISRLRVKLSVLPQACLALGSTHRHTLHMRRAGFYIHTGLLSMEFLTVYSSVLHIYIYIYHTVLLFIYFSCIFCTFLYDIGYKNYT
jgi:hypothetical protein